MATRTPKEARDATICDYSQDFSSLTVRTSDQRAARCIVAASFYMPWSPSKPSERRPKHLSNYRDGWGASYNTRTAYINAYIYLRSMLGMWTTLQELINWHKSLRINADFQLKTHFGSMSGKNPDNTKYVDQGLIESRDGSIRATAYGIELYAKEHIKNHISSI